MIGTVEELRRLYDEHHSQLERKRQELEEVSACLVANSISDIMNFLFIKVERQHKTVCRGEEEVRVQLTDCLQEHGRLQTEDKVHVCTHTHTHTHTHMLAYIHTYTYTHTYIHTHTHHHTFTPSHPLQHHRSRVQSRDQRIHSLAKELKLEDVGSGSLSAREVKDFLTRVASIRKTKEEGARQEKVTTMM